MNRFSIVRGYPTKANVQGVNRLIVLTLVTGRFSVIRGYRCLHVSRLVLCDQKVLEIAKEGAGRHRVSESIWHRRVGVR